jgi:hypothetical protein
MSSIKAVLSSNVSTQSLSNGMYFDCTLQPWIVTCIERDIKKAQIELKRLKKSSNPITIDDADKKIAIEKFLTYIKEIDNSHDPNHINSQLHRW